MNILDLFSGGTGYQGDATTEGAGDGEKGRSITDYLSAITGAYDTITGQGNNGGPAPAAQVAKPAPNYLLIGGAIVAVIVVLMLFKRK